MPNDRPSNRRRVRVLVSLVAIALSLPIAASHAAAQAIIVEPEVQIGEARAVERPPPTPPAAPPHDATGVAVAGIAIARPAPVAPNAGDATASDAAAIVVGSLGGVALVVGSCQLVRRRRYDLLG